MSPRVDRNRRRADAGGAPRRAGASGRDAAAAATRGCGVDRRDREGDLRRRLASPGKDGDWTHLRTIFLPGARLTPPKRPTGEFAFLTAEEFIDRVSKGIASRNAQGGGGDKGFSEREIARRTDCFGNVCQIFSTYESRFTASDAKPFVRGVNAIQVVKDGNRWWVANVVWDQEAEGKPIPAAYSPKS